MRSDGVSAAFFESLSGSIRYSRKHPTRGSFSLRRTHSVLANRQTLRAPTVGNRNCG